MVAQGGYQQTGHTDVDFKKQFEEIQKLLYCPESKQIFNNVKGEDITVFIGNTRSGKSTLVNFAIGNHLNAVKMVEWPFKYTLVKVDDRERGPIIGLESVSETTLPSVWPAPKLGRGDKVVDAPGFEDNRGVAQDIANTFYIKEIIRNAKSVKFVLITDIHDITSQNIGNFTNFFDKIHRIFPDTRILHGGVALVFSKDEENSTVDNVCSFFEKSILCQQNLKVEKALIQYFAVHKECIAFFRMPRSAGPICNVDVDGGILEIIKNKMRGINGKDLSNVRPGISEKSKSFLLEKFADFCTGDEYVDLLQKIKDVFAKKCMELSTAESAEKSININETLLELENKVDELFPQSGSGLNLKNILEKLISLCTICGVINLLESSNIAVHIQFIEFLDQTLNQDNGGIYVGKLQGIIHVIHNHFKMASIIHASTLKRISEQEAERLRREQTEKHNQEMKDIVDKMVHLQQENQKSAHEQIEKQGFFSKCGTYLNKMSTATGNFLGGAAESAGETLDATKDWITSHLPW